MSQMRFLVTGSQLLMGINKLKIVLNWKNTTLFAKTRVTYKTVFPCNSLRSGSTGHVYMILLYPPNFSDECTLIFYCFSESWFKQGFASSAEPARQWSVKFNSILCTHPTGNHEFLDAMELKSNSLAFLAWPSGSHFDMRREKKNIIPHYHSFALWKVESYLSLYNYHFIILWERINLLIAYSYVSHSLLWVSDILRENVELKKKHDYREKSKYMCNI